MAQCSGLNALNVFCHMENKTKEMLGDAIVNMANAVLEGFGKAIAAVGTLWVNIPTPDLTHSGGDSPVKAGEASPGSGNFEIILGYAMWIGFAVAILSLIALGAMIAAKSRAGEGLLATGKAGVILGSVVLISASSSIIVAVLPSGPQNTSGTVLFLQSSLWWLMSALAMLSVILGGIKMIWHQDARHGKETVLSLLTLILVAGAGVTIVNLLVKAFDAFSVWIIDSSLECDVATDQACFGGNIGNLILLNAGMIGPLGALLIIVLGIVAIICSIIQVIMMLARGGMLVILTGILPFAASFTNTAMGKNWFQKCLSWLIAFLLYKPAAAVVYAAAFQLTGTKAFGNPDELVSIITGLMLMVLALVALPALMRFVTPMVSSMASGAAGAAVGAGLIAALPTGASKLLGNLGNKASPGPSGSRNSTPGPTGPNGPTGPGAPNGGNPAATGGRTAAASSGTGAAAASSGTGAAASAGAAAGPVGVAAGAAIQKAQQVGTQVKNTAQGVADSATGSDENSKNG